MNLAKFPQDSTIVPNPRGSNCAITYNHELGLVDLNVNGGYDKEDKGKRPEVTLAPLELLKQHQQQQKNEYSSFKGEGIKEERCPIKIIVEHPATSPVTNSWNRIFQCFSKFKPRKLSTEQVASEEDESGKQSSSSPSHQQQQQSSSNLRRNMTESDFYLYELASNSEILDYQDTRNIGKNLPPRAIGYSWERKFSSTIDGFSLHSLYRKTEGIESPILFVIEDIEGRVFGAMLSCTFKVSENFYGNSDTFLFRCRPNFEVFKWSGENFYFIQGQDSFISVGSDDGRYGLWLDDNLFLGRTEKCSTFNSPPLVEEKDFKVKTVECWTVGLI